MRIRALVCAAACATALVAAAQAPAVATSPTTGGTRAAASPARPTAASLERGGRTVTLVTGQRVHVSGPAGRERITVERRAGSAAAALVVRRSAQHLYVFPVGVERYLGRSLDLSLFDLDAVTIQAGGRTPVRISYRGARPAVPGVHVTSAAHGQARGYLTTRSAPAFGRAVLGAATRGRDSALASGVRSISAAARPTVTASARTTADRRYPMHTLVLKVLTADGKPQARGLLFLADARDMSRYAAEVLVEKGEARVSVPAGTYTAISDDFVQGRTEDTGTITVVTVDEYVVTGDGQTLSIDHRTATGRPSVATPRPADPDGLYVEWNRLDSSGDGELGADYFVDPGVELRLAPAAPARVGSVSLIQGWTLSERGAKVPAYVYSLGSIDDHIPLDPRHTYAPADLATVHATYGGDGSGAQGGFSRAPVFDDGGSGGFILPVQRGTRRTEYAGATAPAQWADTMLLNVRADDDPGFFDVDARALPAGSTSTQTWFRGPLAPGIPAQQGGGFCYACRSGSTLSVGMALVTDSDPTHVGDLTGAGDGLPIARFRLYRGRTLLLDQDDVAGADAKVPAKKATYHVVLDVDRRQNDPRLSTRSRTELGFASAKGQGRTLSDDWFCDGSSSSCRGLPLVQARLSMPTDLNERLPLGRPVVTVRVTPTQNATASASASAGLEYRPAGGDWVGVDLHETAPGVYSGVLDDRGAPGSVDDVRLSASNAAGSTFEQTVSRAFTVAGAR